MVKGLCEYWIQAVCLGWAICKDWEKSHVITDTACLGHTAYHSLLQDTHKGQLLPGIEISHKFIWACEIFPLLHIFEESWIIIDSLVYFGPFMHMNRSWWGPSFVFTKWGQSSYAIFMEKWLTLLLCCNWYNLPNKHLYIYPTVYTYTDKAYVYMHLYLFIDYL